MNATRRVSKPYKFKPLPQLTGEFPLLLDYAIDIRKAKKVSKTEKRLHIDLSRVEEVDVLGAVTLAANLAKSVSRNPEFSFQILKPQNEKVAQTLVDLEFEALLMHLGMKPEIVQDMWGACSASSDLPLVWSATCSESREALLFIPVVNATSRESVLKEVRDTLQIFYSANPSENVNFGQVHQILHEIIKNTIDHSGNVGVLGLKMVSNLNGRDRLSFVHCEIGDGITQNIRDFLRQSTVLSDNLLAEKGGFTEFLHWAFGPGNTTKPHSGVNAGLGLSTIGAAARGEWVRLYLSDARSIAYVTDISDVRTHMPIRKTTYRSIHIPCFMYFGHTT